MYQEIKKIKAIFNEGGNVMEYFRNVNESSENSLEAIKISYDLQAGSYIKFFLENQEYNALYTQAIASVIENLGEVNSICEVGVGEATTFANMITKLKHRPEHNLGFDISWSRIGYGRKFANSVGLTNAQLFTGNLFQIPLADNSVDVVYTSHSIEPNGGREEDALRELCRVASRYVVLLEPAYELANEESQKRMTHHGYVKGLKKTIENIGYKVIEYRLFEHISNPLNPTGLIVVEIQPNNAPATPIFCCPVTGAHLEKKNDCYYAAESFLAYPIVGGIPCLLAENSILASHFNSLIV
jgi:ubiquinone/menaquinone biosynthesis C-methylase UbiE/uncharacterized protein YbaR (Trm112 family)